ncbi:phosphoribosylformylglycinamidine cyclo-ligase [Marinivivus vitaminiproducens]|uniref:phosphoribosylformylglycinamidine cyclo-ligase n=1 Tax=Marinivivus vitaminiproducens TaxID=3035935 RepID=UPI0027A55B48|nr:phosphoribosylformylglycinamidine cyclo-ligase [Geminicoccaceae bacterium SCSIO 64248]
MSNLTRPTSRYREAGVDIDAGNAFARAIQPHARSTARPGADGALGGFGGVFDPKALGLNDPLLVASTDGVGTKLRLLIETGRWTTAGIDLVAMCVNDVVAQGAQPLFFLDYYATGKLDVTAATEVVAGIADGCRQAGCALIGGETAEMPGHYAPGDIDLAGFVVGAVERADLLPRADVTPGDMLIGLASSGVHSNGFSLVRKVLADERVSLQGPAPFATADSFADALLAPTRIYVRACMAAIAAGGVKALAHVTGGGIAENVPRALPDDTIAVIDARSWPLPPLFAWLGRAGGIDRAELARTFNVGIGMVLVVAPDRADAVAEALAGLGETVYRLGTVEAGSGKASVRLEHLEAAWADGEPQS